MEKIRVFCARRHICIEEIVLVDHIRNFCIIAHIDHGKSTLADRLLEYTSTISRRDMQSQVLDNMDLERERGITIKSHAIQIGYRHEGRDYTLNLIDTPGHVDFSYEVSRAMAACEGALLVVDAAQGIEAQTISNVYIALENDLSIIPVINKIDLPSANKEAVGSELCELLGCARKDILYVSAKAGIGISMVFESILGVISPPSGDEKSALQAMIFDSYYNSYRGVVVLFRVFNGSIGVGDRIRFMSTGVDYEVNEVGVMRLSQVPVERLFAGDVGYLISSIKRVGDVKVGDTFTSASLPARSAVRGFEEVKPMIFAGIYPVISAEFEALRMGLEKLQLNDASLVFEPETSKALGFGFRCGFLGMLHLEIVQERLQREFELSVLTSFPSVRFRAYTKQGDCVQVSTPAQLPSPMALSYIEEPYIKAKIITQKDYIGVIMSLCIGKRGIILHQGYLTPMRAELIFELPLSEIVLDFYDQLKRISKGYASFDYELSSYKVSLLVRLDVLLNKERVDALSVIVHRDKAYDWGRRVCEKLKAFIPRQMFEISIQAAIGSKVIARESVRALRKNVTAKCYGGDITRKRKLLEKQKKGKRRMRQIGNVEVPQEAFMAALKL